MRTIKFRGKRVNSCEWIYGYYCYDNRPSGGHFIIQFTGYFEIVKEVIPETVGQFTGLTDINKSDIFENDIVKRRDGVIGFVVYSNGSFWVKTKNVKYHISSFELEIIGNIHDNPELLQN